MRRQLIFLSVLALVLIFILFYLERRRRRESFVVNTPEAILKLNQLSEAARQVLSMDHDDDETLNNMLRHRDVYNEFTMREGGRSYTENKKRIVLCLRKSSDEFYSWNSLMFVLMHELAHVICDELHHTDKFHRINRALMRRAEKLGYYNSKIPFESSYCGM